MNRKLIFITTIFILSYLTACSPMESQRFVVPANQPEPQASLKPQEVKPQVEPKAEIAPATPTQKLDVIDYSLMPMKLKTLNEKVTKGLQQLKLDQVNHCDADIEYSEGLFMSTGNVEIICNEKRMLRQFVFAMGLSAGEVLSKTLRVLDATFAPFHMHRVSCSKHKNIEENTIDGVQSYCDYEASLEKN